MLRPIVAVVLAVAAEARASTVVLDGARFSELRAPDPEQDETKAPAPFAADREVVLTPAEGGFALTATWRIEAPAAGYFDGVLAGPGVRVASVAIDDRPAPAIATTDGTRLVARVERGAVVVLTGFVDGDPRQGILLSLLPAVRGAVRVEGTPLVPRVTDGGRDALPSPIGALASGRELAVTLRDRAPPADKPPLHVATVAVGLTVGDAEATGQAHVEWHVRQGELGGASLVVRGIGADVDVTGPDVRRWRREGDRLVIETERPVRDRLAVDLRWSEAVPAGAEGRVAVPVIEPDGAFRVESTLVLAREDAIEVVPDLAGWEAVAQSELPKAALGLVAGTPTASFRAGRAPGGSLALLRFVPVEQPPAVVDVASTTIAVNDEGRVLMRGYFTVRNERAASLRVVAPDGVVIVGVQVSGAPVLVGRDDGPGWLVPLPRSLETVEGLLSFPIEIVAFGTGPAWERREERDLALFAVDAPVAVQRVTVHLPPGWRDRSETGERGVVDDFSEGESITYGYAVGDVAAAAVDAEFQDALDAWMDNDFELAQEKLDSLRAQGVETENVRKLQSNLDVVDVDRTVGVADAAEDTAMGRRVKEMARARALEEEAKAEEYRREAEELERAGDYAAASSSYSSALAITEKIAGLEQTESIELRGSSASLSGKVAEVGEKAAKQKPKDPGKDANEGAFAFDGVVVTAPVAHATPLVALGDAPDDDLGFLSAGAHGVAIDVAPAPVEAPPPDGDLSFLTENPSLVMGWFAEDEVVTLGVSGTGTGGGGSGYGYGVGSVGVAGHATTMSTLQNVPGVSRGRDGRGNDADAGVRHDEPVEVAARASRGPSVRIGGGGGRGGRGPMAKVPASVEESPLQAIAIGGEEPAEPVVHAASLSVVVPALGETVRYQAVLLPADVVPTVHIAAKAPRGER